VDEKLVRCGIDIGDAAVMALEVEVRRCDDSVELV
jgi:hypothetical protein